ncbi:protein O-mannosyl-transferase TMTC4-like [Ostrinia nubilalis]|uniref:protein O-mannosyl-transferase TMTC4-like n=1 Tax=Ostrinia nubilalis TaxID=29057 RepID=UPI0030826372
MSIEMIFKLSGLVVLSSLPFLFTLNGDFVFDDSEALLKNNDIKSESWTDCFYNDFWGTNIKSAVSHKSYRPLTVLSFRLNYIWNNRQLTVFPFKVTNLLCHIVCCLLVWRTFQKILNTCSSTSLNAIDISYFATLLFAVHPIHVEAVSGIVGRADLLCAITFFIAFLLYNKAMTNDKFSFVTLLLSVSMAAISMLFKENGVTVLGFCLFYEVINALDKSKEDLKNPRNISRMGILCVSIVLLLYARWTVMGGTKPKFSHLDNPAAFSDSLFRKIATYNYIYFINFLILIWPQWLCCDWSMGCIPLIKKVTDVRLLFILLLYAYAIALLVAIFEIKNKVFSRPLLLSAALMVIPFIPAANIFYPVGFVIAERIFYIPSAGYCLIIVIGLNKIILSRNQYKMGVFCYGILLLSMGLRSWQRSYDWQNEYQLFTSGVSVCPRNAKIHYNVAKVADANNETKFAMQSYRQALR